MNFSFHLMICDIKTLSCNILFSVEVFSLKSIKCQPQGGITGEVTITWIYKTCGDYESLHKLS